MISTAMKKDFVDHILDFDALLWAIDWIGKNVEPIEVYSDQQLEAWARNNGFVKEDEL